VTITACAGPARPPRVIGNVAPPPAPLHELTAWEPAEKLEPLGDDDDRIVRQAPAATVVPQAPPVIDPPDPQGEELVRRGDDAFVRAELDLAEGLYEQAVAMPSVAGYANYKLAWIALDRDDAKTALADFMQAAADPRVQRAAEDDMTLAYAQVGDARKALAFFTHVDHARAIELLERLGDRYADLGSFEAADQVQHEAAAREVDPARACHAHVRGLEARLVSGTRDQILDDLAAVIARAPDADDECRVSIDRIAGTLAWVWHTEMPKSETDPRQVVRAWELAAQAATTPARRAAAMRNRKRVPR